MKVLIVGAGEVGFNIASRLVDEGHDVTVVERDEVMLNRATDGLDVQGLRGHGARPAVLDEAGISSAQMLVAVTNSDEVNMVACLIGAILGPSNIIKIARVRDSSYLDERVFGDARVQIDLVINPEQVTAEKILSLLRYREVTEVIDFADGQVQLVGLRVHPVSPLAGLRFMDFRRRFPDIRVLIAAVHRGDEVIIPRGDDVVLPGDEVYVVVPTAKMDSTLKVLGVPITPVSRVMIAGGTKIGRAIARVLCERGLKPKIIEPDPKLARWLSDELPTAVVLEGRPTDAELLQEENAGEMEAFIAVSRDEEANVMSALLAQRMGAKRVIVTTNRGEYPPLMKHIGIDVCISPRLVAVSSILHFIRRGHVVAARALGDEESAEALEFEAHMLSAFVGTPIAELKIPRDAMIAIIQRGDTIIMPSGSTQIEEGDRVVIVALKSAIPKVERMAADRIGGRS